MLNAVACASRTGDGFMDTAFIQFSLSRSFFHPSTYTSLQNEFVSLLCYVTSSTGCLVTPMTLSPLLEAAASSSSSEVLRNVETQLKSLEVRPGFHSSLLTIIQHSTDDGTSDVMRLQVMYKNSPPRFVLLRFSSG